MLRESDDRYQLLSPDQLLPLTTVRDAELLGLHAIAHVKLYTPDCLFTAYLAGFDGTDTFFGLICAREIYVGRLYFSGLTVAWNVWGIPIQHDQQFKALSLQHLIQDKRIDVNLWPNTIVPNDGLSRERIRSRLCMHLAKESHHLYCNR